MVETGLGQLAVRFFIYDVIGSVNWPAGGTDLLVPTRKPELWRFAGKKGVPLGTEYAILREAVL